MSWTPSFGKVLTTQSAKKGYETFSNFLKKVQSGQTNGQMKAASATKSDKK